MLSIVSRTYGTDELYVIAPIEIGNSSTLYARGEFHLAFYVDFDVPYTESRSSWGFKPYNSGPRNRFGDKDCIHHQAKGTLVFDNICVEDVDTDTSVPRRIYSRSRSGDRPDRYLFSLNDYIDVQFDDSIHGWSHIVKGSCVYTREYSDSGYNYRLNYFPLFINTYDDRRYFFRFIVWQVRTMGSSRQLRWGWSRFDTSTIYGYVKEPVVPESVIAQISRYMERVDTSPDQSPSVLLNQTVEVDTKKISRLLEGLQSATTVVAVDNNDFGRLARDIVDDASFPQVNIPAYVRDILKTPADFMRLVKSIKHADIKSLSDAYLSYKYGTSLSVRDTLELIHHVAGRLTKCDWQSRKASKMFTATVGSLRVDVRIAYKVYFSLIPSESVDIIDEAFAADIVGLSNVWDMVPFSFVADWFINVGDFLEQLDSTVRFNTLPVDSSVKSTRRSIQLDSSTIANFFSTPGINVSGALEYVSYERIVLPELILPDIAWEAPSEFGHYLESSALIVSTRYRRR